MAVKIAVVQPATHAPPQDERNVADAVAYVERAAAEGAHFVTFPESYPGPWRMPASFDPTAEMAAAARRCGVHVVFGTLEPIDEADGTAHNLVVLAHPDGSEPTIYRRTHPPGPWIYSGGEQWDFEYVTGAELVFLPAGTVKQRLWETWRTLQWQRPELWPATHPGLQRVGSDT